MQLLHGAADAAAFGEARYAARFTLRVGPLEATVVQLVPQEFADDAGRRCSAPATPCTRCWPSASPSPRRRTTRRSTAVERTARIAAESAAQVLSTLIGGEASATLPSVVQDPEDPLGKPQLPAA